MNCNNNNSVSGKPDIFYKYMTLERFLGSVDDYLAGKVYFSKPKDFSDPMEHMIKLESRIIRRKSVPYKVRDADAEACRRLAEIRVCCLSAQRDNAAMWTQYAQGHTGVCVGFKINPNIVTFIDSDEAGSYEVDNEHIVCADINYDSYIPAAEKWKDDKLSPLYWKDVKKLFCSKLEDYKLEKELRLMVLPDGTAGKEWEPFRKIGEIFEIILGVQFNTKIARWLKSEHKDIVIKQVEKRECKKGQWELVVPESSHEFRTIQSHNWKYETTPEGAVILGFLGRRFEFAIPERRGGSPVIAIGEGAFQNALLTRITSIPGTVTRIEPWTFYRCINLVDITLPPSVTSIGNGAFRRCVSLPKITIPGSVEKIGTFAFSYCDELTDVTIENGVKTISEAVFAWCTKLPYITIPASVTRIEGGAFKYCDSLSEVVFEEGSNITDKNFSKTDAFPGNLRDMYLGEDGGAGTYRRDHNGKVWEKQH